MATLKQLINEELYGDLATVYHRFNTNDAGKVRRIFEGTYKNLNAIDFNKYSGGIYTTMNMDSQLSKRGYNNMAKTYGNAILKCALKNINKFMILDFDYYKKLHPNANKDTFREEQLKKLGIEKYFDGYENHVQFSSIVEENNLFDKVAGIIYYGKHDGDCVLAYNNKTIYPISISTDEGKTWQSYKEKIKILEKELPEQGKKFKELNDQRKEAYRKSNINVIEPRKEIKHFKDGEVKREYVLKAALVLKDRPYLIPIDLKKKLYYYTKKDEGKLHYVFNQDGEQIKDLVLEMYNDPEKFINKRDKFWATLVSLINGKAKEKEINLVSKAENSKRYILSFINKKYKNELKKLDITIQGIRINEKGIPRYFGLSNYFGTEYVGFFNGKIENYNDRIMPKEKQAEADKILPIIFKEIQRMFIKMNRELIDKKRKAQEERNNFKKIFK